MRTALSRTENVKGVTSPPQTDRQTDMREMETGGTDHTSWFRLAHKTRAHVDLRTRNNTSALRRHALDTRYSLSSNYDETL